MDPSPYFSIITCTYNSERYLDQCIRSVQQQTFQDFEHIFVDAYSTDGTLSIIEKYTQADPRAKLFQADPKGIANAMNEGIRHSKGRVIQHLHSDDYYHSAETLQTVFDAFSRKPRGSMVIGLCSRDIDGNVTSGLLSGNTFLRRKIFLRTLMYVNCYIAHPSTFIKKEVFNRHGLFDESFRIAMDYEYWLRVLGNERYFMINRELTTFRHHLEAASSDQARNKEEERRARKLYSKSFRAILARKVFAHAVEMKTSWNQNSG